MSDMNGLPKVEEEFTLISVYMGMMTTTGYSDGHQAKHDGGALFNAHKAQEVKVIDSEWHVYLDLAADENWKCIRRIVNPLPN